MFYLDKEKSIVYKKNYIISFNIYVKLLLNLIDTLFQLCKQI